ncbi:MFS transporter [Phytohabitans sp. LJ34]|uniref:MFS transporter n=1 Tax=Phytohabitans sp. LJ34 TaxID=3452217 RepID=UPI003F8B75EC
MSRPRVTLAVSVAGAMLVALDGTVLTVAYPTLRRDLDATFAQVQWSSTGYLIAVAGLLVVGGRLGDLYGHRRLLLTGILGFAASSAAIGLAPGIGWVVALRVAQGAFGALLQPATLGLLRTAYPAARLGSAIALRTSAIAAAGAAGPVLGGAVVGLLGWRAVFLLGVVPAAVVAALALAVPAASPTGRGGPDVLGAALYAATLAGLVLAIVHPPLRWPALAAGLGCAVAFGRHERRSANPLVPPAVLRVPAVPVALGVLACASGAAFGTLFAATYLVQDGLGLDPLHSGLLGLGLTAAMIVASPAASRLMRRHGARPVAVGALLTAAAGIASLARAERAVLVGAGLVLLGAGLGAVMVVATATVVGHAPVEAAGVVGGLQQTAMNTGPVAGIAAAAALMDHGMAGAFLLLAAVAGIGAALATRLPRPVPVPA